MSDETLARRFDTVPYESNAFAFTHPSRLAALARLAGLGTIDPERSRVLELGCAGGGNLIPMALTLPRAQFVGIDLSQRQISDARHVASDLGLRNIELCQLNIRDIGPDLGQFDLIVAHGVFSWVPPEVQEKVLSVCAHHLALAGVAMISFNTYPGWFARGMLRELMQLHAPNPSIEEAKEVLMRLSEWFALQGTPFAQLIRDELESSRRWSDNQILYDYLANDNRPMYFHEFVAKAAAHGLMYLCDADPAASAVEQFPEDIQTSLRATARNDVELGQLIDVLRKRTMRKAMLCHANASADRVFQPDRLAGQFVSAKLTPEPGSTTQFVFGNDQRINTGEANVAAALARLAERWPMRVAVDELLREFHSPNLRQTLVGLMLRGGAEIDALPAPFVVDVSERPVASVLALRQAATQGRVTTLAHDMVDLDESHRQLLMMLDGRSDRSELVDRAANALEGNLAAKKAAGLDDLPAGELREALAEGIDEGLQRLARLALLAR